MNPFPNNLRTLREDRGKSQEELADDIGVSRQTIGGWETGRCEPNICTLVKLAKVLEVSVDELIKHDVTRPRRPMLVYDPNASIHPQHVNFLSKFDHENENNLEN